MPDQGKQLFKFALDDEKQDVVEFSVGILAEDQTKACLILAAYISELKDKASFRVPSPVAGSSDPKIIADELIKRLNRITDPIASILTLHLFTEHWLNEILLKFCLSHDLTDHRYSVKLDIAHGMGKLTEDLFYNLTKLNRLRNQVAHNVDFDFAQMDLDYRACPPHFELREFRPTLDPTGAQHHILNVLKGVMAQTYMLLHKHCFDNLGFRRTVTTTPPSSSR